MGLFLELYAELTQPPTTKMKAALTETSEWQLHSEKLATLDWYQATSNQRGAHKSTACAVIKVCGTIKYILLHLSETVSNRKGLVTFEAFRLQTVM